MPLSDAAVGVLEGMGRNPVEFRTWAAERSGAKRDVAELALAHAVGGAVERSYARSDLFDQRRGLMDRWAAFVSGPAATPVRPPLVAANERSRRRRRCAGGDRERGRSGRTAGQCAAGAVGQYSTLRR